MKYVKALATAKIPLIKDAEIVKWPDGEDGECLKIKDDFYDIEIVIVKYDKKKKDWIDVDAEEIWDTNFTLDIDAKYSEIKSKPEASEEVK